MRHVRLGRSGLSVSRLCLGTMTFGCSATSPPPSLSSTAPPQPGSPFSTPPTSTRLDAIEGSLRRLRTGYVDLHHLHHPDAGTPLDETLRALDDIVRAGKARYGA